MNEVPVLPHDDVLERKNVLLWSKQVHWVKENCINLSSLLRTLLCKEIKKRSGGRKP